MRVIQSTTNTAQQQQEEKRKKEDEEVGERPMHNIKTIVVDC